MRIFFIRTESVSASRTLKPDILYKSIANDPIKTIIPKARENVILFEQTLATRPKEITRNHIRLGFSILKQRLRPQIRLKILFYQSQ